MRSTMDLIEDLNQLNPGSASGEWDDKDGDGIPDGAEVSRVVSRTMPDGTAIKTTASWTKQPAGAMRLMEPGASNADIVANYPRAGSGITANQYRGAIFAGPNTRTIQGQERADAGNRQMLATRNMQILGAQEAEANRSMMTALQESRNRSAESLGRMKLQGDEAVARSSELAAAFGAAPKIMESLMRPQDQTLNFSPRGDFVAQGGRVTPLPQPDPGKLEMSIDKNTGATVLTQGGKFLGVVEQPKASTFPPFPAEQGAATAQASKLPQGQTRDSVRAALKQANPNLSDAELDAYLKSTYGV